MLFEYMCTVVSSQVIYMMRCFLDLSDDGLAVTLEGAGHNHEPSEMQATLQGVAAYLPDLRDPKRSNSASNKMDFFTDKTTQINQTISERCEKNVIITCW